MLERTQTRALPVINKAVDLAPAAQACCGVCRECMTTNVFALAGTVALSASSLFARVARRDLLRR